MESRVNAANGPKGSVLKALSPGDDSSQKPLLSMKSRSRFACCSTLSYDGSPANQIVPEQASGTVWRRTRSSVG